MKSFWLRQLIRQMFFSEFWGFMGSHFTAQHYITELNATHRDEYRWNGERHILGAFCTTAVLTGEYYNQNKLLPCSYPAVLMRDSCTQGGISTAGSFSENWINICCAVQNVKELKTNVHHAESQFADSASFSFFHYYYSSPLLYLFWSESACAHVCTAVDMCQTSERVCVCACVRFRLCYLLCRRLVLTIWLLEKHLHLWRQWSTCCVSQQRKRLSKSLERREELSQTQTDSFWCLAMKPVGDLWPHHNMRLENLEDKTFSFNFSYF